MNTQSLVGISTEVLTILKSHQLIKSVPDVSQIEEFVSEWQSYDYVHPLEILTTQSLSQFNLVRFDDCNTYQDEGFYLRHLQKLALASQGKIHITDILETWNGLQVMISFKLNGILKELAFSVDEEPDVVPETFCDAIEQIALTEIDGWTFVAGHTDEEGTSFFHVPVEAAKELSDLEQQYTKKP
ncbi:hypothetical protein [Gynuella sunshinyii]|uniref:hypothetical protein n=1 Tax=Gynuella sunshinyii TaxID=1445505 RepID=UPI0005CC5BB3|nr:hypothetical protein [Gynuella sunshinyii]